MIVSALMAVALFAPPETTQSGAAAPAPEAKAVVSTDAKPAGEAKATKQCYTATPSGSRLPRRVCVTQAAEKVEAEAKK
jgi:hypothetical protein